MGQFVDFCLSYILLLCKIVAIGVGTGLLMNIVDNFNPIKGIKGAINYLSERSSTIFLLPITINMFILLVFFTSLDKYELEFMLEEFKDFLDLKILFENLSHFTRAILTSISLEVVLIIGYILIEIINQINGHTNKVTDEAKGKSYKYKQEEEELELVELDEQDIKYYYDPKNETRIEKIFKETGNFRE